MIFTAVVCVGGGENCSKSGTKPRLAAGQTVSQTKQCSRSYFMYSAAAVCPFCAAKRGEFDLARACFNPRQLSGNTTINSIVAMMAKDKHCRDTCMQDVSMH